MGWGYQEANSKMFYQVCSFRYTSIKTRVQFYSQPVNYINIFKGKASQARNILHTKSRNPWKMDI